MFLLTLKTELQQSVLWYSAFNNRFTFYRPVPPFCPQFRGCRNHKALTTWHLHFQDLICNLRMSSQSSRKVHLVRKYALAASYDIRHVLHKYWQAMSPLRFALCRPTWRWRASTVPLFQHFSFRASIVMSRRDWSRRRRPSGRLWWEKHLWTVFKSTWLSQLWAFSHFWSYLGCGV